MSQQGARVRATHFSFRFLPSFLLLLVALLGAATPALADVRHFYDEKGRLIETVGPNGESVRYEYDAAGNLTAVNRLGTNNVTVTSVTPNFGQVGTTVTIS